MEVKKIVEGMTAPEVAQVIDDNFKAQNKILEEDIATQNSVIGVSEYKDFSEAEAVNVGDVRKYNGLLYECVEATTGAFDASKWKKSSFKAETEKKLSELASEVTQIIGGEKRLDVSNGLAYQRKTYLDENGNIAAAGSESWYISDLIPLKGINSITLYARANWNKSVYVLLDESQNVLSRGIGTDVVSTYEITDFQSAEYIRFHSTLEDSYAVLNYEPKAVTNEQLNEFEENLNKEIDVVNDKIKAIEGYDKRLDTSNGLVYQRKKYLNESGELEDVGSEAWYVSDLIPTNNISKIVFYARTNWNFSTYVLIDENGNILSRGVGIADVKTYEITDLTNAKYIRFHSVLDDSYAILTYDSPFVKKDELNEGINLADKNVLVIGDSISTGTSSAKRNSKWSSYGNYDKWVDRLIATGFFSDEKTYNCSWHATGFVADQNGSYDSFVKRIKAIEEPSKYEYVVVFGGINDWIKSVPIQDFKAKVDEFFEYLINNFTTAKILVCTPLQCYNYEVSSRYGANNAGHTQKDYANCIEEVCENYALQILDLRRYSGFCPINEKFRNRWTLVTENPSGGYWPADGTHPVKEYEDDYLAPKISHAMIGL